MSVHHRFVMNRAVEVDKFVEENKIREGSRNIRRDSLFKLGLILKFGHIFIFVILIILIIQVVLIVVRNRVILKFRRDVDGLRSA